MPSPRSTPSRRPAAPPRLTRRALALCCALVAAWPAPSPAAPLEAVLDEVLAGGTLAGVGARVGISVVSLDTGALRYQHHADVLLNPASNVKLFTSAAALLRLGQDFRFETELLTDGPLDARGAARTLHLRGKGDPSLTTERLWALSGDLVHAGLRRVGDLVLDDAWFDGERIGPGFDQEDGDKAYLAPASACSLNFNTVAIHVAPGDRPGAPARVEVEPDSPFFEVQASVSTVGARGARRLMVSSVAANGRQRIIVDGRFPQGAPPTVVWRKIDDPPRYLGETLKRLLELRGVKVTGQVRLGPVPAGAKLLLVAESEPLGEVVRRLNKASNNFMAEQLVKAMGAASAGPPGRWSTGIASVEGALAELGLPRGAYLMKNGSGLNDANRFSARQVTTLLVEMWRRFPVAAEFLASLPVAGKDGTLRNRIEGTEAVGRVRAKTGTLDGVTALSGYAEGAGHERLAFAILVNDVPGRAGDAALAVDALAAALASGRAPLRRPAVQVATRGAGAAAGPAGEGAVALPPTVVTATPEAAVKQAVTTYLAMGRAADRRNVRFLRSALPAEAEPAVRLAVAEALYRSEPDAEVVRRAFLEAVRPALAPEPLAAVIAASEPGDPAPILSALADLGADGNSEALGALVALAPGAARSPMVNALLGAVLIDLAEVIPEPLRAAALAAPPATRAAAADLLGDKLPGAGGAAAEGPGIGPATGAGAGAVTGAGAAVRPPG